jgi:hypothetical protein
MGAGEFGSSGSRGGDRGRRISCIFILVLLPTAFTFFITSDDDLQYVNELLAESIALYLFPGRKRSQQPLIVSRPRILAQGPRASSRVPSKQGSQAYQQTKEVIQVTRSLPLSPLPHPSVSAQRNRVRGNNCQRIKSCCTRVSSRRAVGIRRPSTEKRLGDVKVDQASRRLIPQCLDGLEGTEGVLAGVGDVEKAVLIYDHALVTATSRTKT